MRKILDKMFENKKLSLPVSLAAALLMYLLFILFGTAEDKRSYMVALPVISVILFGGVYVGIRIQKNISFFLLWDFVELLAAVAFPIYSIAYSIAFIASGFQSFNPGCILGFVAYGAIALAHNGEALLLSGTSSEVLFVFANEAHCAHEAGCMTTHEAGLFSMMFAFGTTWNTSLHILRSKMLHRSREDSASCERERVLHFFLRPRRFYVIIYDKR